ncbi:hypothetical protein [Ruminococcus sp.]|uniref:hypothetical protein n=1 Tax=Ruminococcus sp. TaxID=41978 RepID=UPI001B528C87|nr:hypothetical protein [Ruminococcus sp.]MBP5433461.1 hypothetical protein [Ruminococcus sp.]
MSSFYWQILSEIFLGIGVVLMLTAVLIAARYRIVSGMISELRAGKNTAQSSMAAPRARTDPMALADADDEEFREELEKGEITVVVAPKKEETADATVVVSVEGEEGDFRMTRNILVINADPDVIDSKWRSK